MSENSEFFGGYKPRKGEVRYSLIGFPFDSTASYKSGQRFGPSEIRRASRYIEFNSLRTNLDLDELGGIYDEGDVVVVIGDPKETIRRVAKVYEDLLKENKFPIMIGGEHTGTLGALTALKRSNPCLIWIDAHMDLRQDYLGCRYSHASSLRRIMEVYGGSLRAFLLGIRGFSREELTYVENRDIEIVTSREAVRIGVDLLSLRLRKFLADCDTYYLSIDMDVFDPSFAPGVGNPEPEGLSPSFILDVLWNTIDNRLIGFDVMETNPQADLAGITSILAAKIIVELTTMHIDKTKKIDRETGV